MDIKKKSRPNMRYRSKVWAGCISIITFFTGVLLTVLLINPNTPIGLIDLTENVILITSFIVSFVAFIFSMITYFSVDAVSSVTEMDGNVLGNESYSIAYAEQVDVFQETTTKEEFRKKLIEEVMPPNKTDSCIAFADSLQKIIDYIIWFSYAGDANDESDKIIELIEHERKRYAKLSAGINHILDENVKLIKCVFYYQRSRDSKQSADFSKIENVRGTMLKNPIAQIIYYNYMGLDYRRKANEIMIPKEQRNFDDFTDEYIKVVKNRTYSKEERMKFECFINMAEENLNKAWELAKGNALWKSYVSYSRLRVMFMQYLMGKDNLKESLEEQMDNTIQLRKNARMLYQREGSYLNEILDAQVKNVENIKNNYKKIVSK